MAPENPSRLPGLICSTCGCWWLEKLPNGLGLRTLDDLCGDRRPPHYAACLGTLRRAATAWKIGWDIPPTS